MRGDDLVRHPALPFVVIKEPGERDVLDHHVGILGPVVELRPLSRPAQEEDLEPAVLGPSKVGDDASHGHQRRGRKDGPAGIRFGQSLAFPANERALQIEPADQLSPLVGHERRAIPGQCHERGNILPAPSGDRFFDWGDASVAHPFTSLLIALRAMADTFGLPPGDPVLRRFRDAYLEPWGLGRGAAGAQPARLGRGNCGSRRRRGAGDEVSDRCPAARRAGARRCCRRRRSRPSAPSLPAGPPPRRQGRPRPRPLPCA
jgi:hypothetical protein